MSPGVATSQPLSRRRLLPRLAAVTLLATALPLALSVHRPEWLVDHAVLAIVLISLSTLAASHAVMRRLLTETLDEASSALQTQLAALRQTEQRMAIAERSARLDAVFDLSPDGFVVFDRDGHWACSNRAFESMMGWEGSPDRQDLTLPEFDRRMHALRDPAQAYPALATVHAGAETFETMDLLHLAQPRPRVLTRLVRHNAGGQGESILYFRDVTHETEVDRMKSEFLTTAAHELRTPMVSVYGFTELLLNRPVTEVQRRDVLETMHRQASLLIGMVNELLDLARIESRQGKDLQRERQALGALLARAVSAMNERDPSRPVLLRQQHADARIHVDAGKFQRALGNVLSNAFKYSSPGSDVTLDTVLGSLGGQPAVGVRVRDQGIGMTRAQLARVFERFYRADPSGSRPGTGLGMSLVKEIVELHGGHVDIDSELGRGTAVTLWFPLSGDDAADPPAA